MQPSHSTVYSLLFLLIFRRGLHAQAAPEISSGAVAHPPASNAPIVLPLEYVNRFLYITLNDERLGSLTLLVDTGTEDTTIAKEAAEKGDIHKSFFNSTNVFVGYGNRTNHQKNRTVAISLRSGNTPILSGSAVVADFGELSKQYKHPVDGILGWDFFERWCTTLDFPARHLILRNLSECAPPAGKHGTLKGEWSTHGLLLPSVLTFSNKRSAKAILVLDTGSDCTLILNTQFRAVVGLGESGPANSEAKGWGVNGELRGDAVPISNINFEDGAMHLDGNEGTEIVIARRGSISKLHWWQGGIGEAKLLRDGGMGNGILEHLTWTFDPAAKRIYVEAAAQSNPSKTP